MEETKTETTTKNETTVTANIEASATTETSPRLDTTASETAKTQGIPATASETNKTQGIHAAASETTKPHGIPATTSETTKTQGIPATSSETTKAQDIHTTTDGRLSDVDPACSTSLFKEVYALEVSELLDRLDSEALTALRIHFYEKKVDEKIKEPKGSAHPRFRGFKLKKDEFISAIESVLDSNQYEDTASRLFERVVEHNAEEHKGFLWWEQILDELIGFMSEKTKSRPENIVKESFCSLFSMPHCRRESIVRVVEVETPTSFCLVVVSKYGKVGIYDWNMSLLEQYEVRLSTQIATTAGGEVRRTTWVTDALYMSDAAMLLVAASDRSLHFYSTSGLVCVPIYHISGLPNTPTCLHYTTAVTAEGPSMLLVGDDHGSIATMYFQQPQYALFKRTSNDALDKYFWKELNSQKDWVIIAIDQGIHKDEITRVEYFRDNNTVVSCSNDPNTTVIIRYIVGRRAPYVFKISRGVRCFHLERSLRLLVTGGKDSVVRLWNPIIPRKPIASLFGHKTCIVDVRILKYLSVVLSMSKDTIVKVWDIVGQTCMQTLTLLFPVHGMLARPPEFGVKSFYPGPVSCKPAHSTPTESETEIFFSPRTLTAASSSGLGKSQNTLACNTSASAHSKCTTALSAKFGTVNSRSMDSKRHKPDTLSGHTVVTGHDESDTATVRTRASEGRTVTKMTTMTRYTMGTSRSDILTTCTESPWTRMELMAVCCNYIVILQLSERELLEGETTRVGEPLNPPLRNQDPVAPSPWLTVDSALLTGFTDDDTQPPLREDGAGVPYIPPAVLATLQRNLGEDMTREFTALAATCHSRDSQQTDLKQIRAMVDQCAPHLALGAVEMEEIPFNPIAAVNVHKGRRKVEEGHTKDTLLKTKGSCIVDGSTSCSGVDTTTTSTSQSTSTSKIE